MHGSPAPASRSGDLAGTPAVRFTASLISFFNPAYWGLPADLPYPAWEAAFAEDPRRYFEAMLDGLREAGIGAVELSPDPGGWRQALDAYGSAQAFRSALAERGLVMSSSFASGKRYLTAVLADPGLQGEVDDAFEDNARFAAEVGAAIIVMTNVPRSRFGNDAPDETVSAEDFTGPVDRNLHERFAEQLNRLGAITARHGVRIAVHTEAYSVCTRPEDISVVMALTDPALVSLCPDAGHIVLDGGDPVAVLREHIDRIPIMHWKDCVGPLAGHTLRGTQKERHATMLRNFRVLGAGTIDWGSWVDVLAASRWSGWAVEEIDHAEDPVGDLRAGLRYYETELAHRYAGATR
ncbi:MAG TPA: sugar phosphate isomerase/epimerase [Rugosimonospora sp.]|nr:sugar phosphate isomerase/epimerase [Rugosimonospora sp.]